MPDESVRVAVRVRPFNQREKDRQAKLIIQMQGKTTLITNPESKEEPKKFAFDFSYWSHDCFKERGDGYLEPTSNKYSDQRMVFEDLGRGVLNNAFEGYNCSLFAYGQTGSGKSYSMVGYGNNKGIVPITCDELFQTMDKNKSDGNVRYEVTFSMLEIYNEQVRDLLSKDAPRGGLPVRQNPKLGLFYVQGLKKVPVGSYKEIEQRMEQGTSNRTVASTNMNATSSRAHTVVTITFDQICKNEEGSETKKSSVMNLVDLAGSERADSTGATGDRLKEGANINKSLSALGNVISALADLSMGKKKVLVPYRDSVLTKLLQNALGGNSKTIMIAALSPADINYDETLGTLRYADRAKKIKNKAVVNENPMDKLIRELREENERLKKAMDGGGLMAQNSGASGDEKEKMRKEMEEEIRAQLMANMEMLEDSAVSWDDKLQAARDEEVVDIRGDSGRKTKEPHLSNLNEDPMLAGMICHFLKEGSSTVGRKDGDPDIVLSGLSIQKNHAIISIEKGEVEIKPGGASAKTKVNGQPLTGTRVLLHKDRILFGSNHLYVFKNPLKQDTGGADLPAEVDYEFAQKEIAQAKGFATGSGAGLSKEQQIAQEQILEILPMVTEVNAISEELDKHRTFEVVLISGAAQESSFKENKSTNAEQKQNMRRMSVFQMVKLQQTLVVMVKMKNLLNGNTWLWERGKFMNRRYLMQEMYQKYLDGEDISKIKHEEDPFWEPAEDVLIGTSNVFLQSLGYALDFDDKISVTDYKGQEEGSIYVNVTPCTQAGKPQDEDFFIEDPKELLGEAYHFKVTIRGAEVNKARFSKGLMIKYKVFKDGEYTVTPTIKGTLTPEFKHSRIISYPSITEEHLEYFDNGSITFLLYGLQEDSKTDPKLQKMTTRELRQMEHLSKPNLTQRHTSFALNQDASDQSHLKSELMVLQRKYDRLESKEKRIQQLCSDWKEKKPEEQEFDAFHRAISAAANSTGTRLKTRVKLLNKYSDTNSEIMSLYYFGEDEEMLLNEANQNGGVVKLPDYWQSHIMSSRNNKVPHMLQAQKLAQATKKSNGTGDAAKVTNSQGQTKEGSKACSIM
ncbi:kinesin-like protein KIF28 isoform X2 [Lineus longissimus]|uniref:kinesin-like protein KIF28 isoform X2 n=1 Tax=Lineus longissimus TaxID=88925 RepID=UPI00315D1158